MDYTWLGYAAGIAIVLLTIGLVTRDAGLWPINPTGTMVASESSLTEFDIPPPREAGNAPSFSDLTEVYLMGRPTHAPSAVMTANLPETALQIGLIGTFTSDNDRASAVIAVENEQSRRLYPGETIQKGVILNSVHENEVVISRGAVLEVLKLYEPTPHSDPSRYQRGRPNSALRYPLNP